MFKFLLGVLLLASNFLGVSRAIAKTGAGAGPGAMTMPIRGRARWAALALALALLPTAANAQNAYITNVVDSTVSVIDTTTNTSRWCPDPRWPPGPGGVAVTPDGAKAYVTNNQAPEHGLGRSPRRPIPLPPQFPSAATLRLA